MKLTWLYYLPCCVLLGTLTACGQDPAISADEKLSPITSQIPPPHKPMTEPTVVAPLVYQLAKDPFVNPYRTAPSSADTPNTRALPPITRPVAQATSQIPTQPNPMMAMSPKKVTDLLCVNQVLPSPIIPQLISLRPKASGCTLTAVACVSRWSIMTYRCLSIRGFYPIIHAPWR